MLEFVAQGVFEVLLYGTGKVVSMLFLPHLAIEPLEKQKSMPRFKWVPFTYTKGNCRFLYTESVQVIGLAFWVIVGLWVFIILKYAI